MDTFLNSASAMLMMLIILALGYLARKLNMTDDTFDEKLSAIVIRIACPAIVLDSVLGNENLPGNDVMWQVLGISFLSFIPVFLVAFIVPRLYPVPNAQRWAHTFIISFSNVGLVGFAVCNEILGSESVLYLAIFNIASTTLVYSVGAWMISCSGTVKLTRKEQLTYVRKNLVSPIMAACILALVLALLHVTDDGIIGSTCELLGSMTAPAAMLVIGSTLAKYEIRSMISSPWMYVTVFGRLLLVPLLVYFVCGFFINDAYVLAALTLVSGTPVAMIGTVMSLIYGGDEKILSQGTFLSTVFSTITIPLLTLLVL